MKKCALTILSLFYLLTATGFNLHFHYCMGALAGVDITAPRSNTCGKCGMDKSEAAAGCCQDTSESIKLDIDQKQQQAYVYNDLQLAAPPAVFNDACERLFYKDNHTRKIFPPEADDGRIPIFILHCTYRI